MFETWYRMSGLIQSGLDLDPVITHRLPLSRFQEGFETMASGQSGKIILDWEAV
jgi:threonine 3-dehydrogenase